MGNATGTVSETQEALVESQPPANDDFDRKLEEAASTRQYKYQDSRRGWGNIDEATLAELGHPIQTPNGYGPGLTIVRKESALTDLGNAERLAWSNHGRWINVRRGSSVGEDLVYGNGVWRPDVHALVDSFACGAIDSTLLAAARCTDVFEKKRLLKWALKCQHRQRIDAMISLARRMPPIAISHEELDKDDYKIATENYTVNLRTGKGERHKPNNYITKRVPVEFDPEAECPRFLQFLNEITGTDAALIGFLQRLTGYCLTGDVREQVLPIFIGKGANGKSTLIDLIIAMLGEYAAPAPPNLLTARPFDQHPCEIAALQGKRLVVASEFEEGRSLRASFVKSITGDAFLMGRLMRENFHRFRRTHKTILVANVRPRITEQTDAIWRRLIVVPFNESFVGREDKELPAKLAAEMPGVLNWAIQGCLAWQRDGLAIPRRITEATAGYRASEDTLPKFIEDCLVVADDARISRPEVFQLYCDWAHRNREQRLDAPVLYERLRSRGFPDGRWKQAGEAVRGFTGIGKASVGDTTRWRQGGGR